MFWQVIGVALVGTLAVATLRSIKPELGVFAGTATAIVIILMISSSLSEVIAGLGGAGGSGGAGLNTGIFKAIIKIIGIGYVTEYAASVCEDYGSQSIAKNVHLAGKVSIFLLAIPIITGIIDAIGAIIK